MDANTLKQLKVKTGSLKRNVKDLEYAEKELAKEQKRLEGFEAEKDEDKIRQQKKVLDETNQMIPISIQRLKATFEDVSQFSAELPPAPTALSEEEAAKALEGADEETIKKKTKEQNDINEDLKSRDAVQEALTLAKDALKARNIEVEDASASVQKVEGADDDY